jgi:hypothetical protein
MAITQTNLTVAMTATDLVMTVNSGTGFPTSGGTTPASNYLVRIDKEFMLAILQPTAGVITVAQRGYNGTVAAAHDKLAKVEVSSAPGDFAQNPAASLQTLPAYLPNYQTLGQDTTFTTTQVAAWGNQPQNFAITKATAAAITLVAPSKGQDGLEIVFTSLTAAAHVITATSLLANAGTASPYTTATMANAEIGGGLILQAQNGLWNVLSAVNWTLT